MKLHRPLAALLAAALLVPALAAQGRVPGYLTLERLEEELDLTLDWIRAQQDEETGGYGGVERTAWAVKAFAASHHHHRYDAGPFVSRAVDRLLALQDEDGSIHDPDARSILIRKQTVAAARALRYLTGTPKVEEAHARAAAAFTEPAETPPKRFFAPRSDAQMYAFAEDILLRRNDEGYWERGDALLATCRNAVTLGQVHQELTRRAAASEQGAEAAADGPTLPKKERKLAVQGLERGARFLLERSQDGRWGFPGKVDPGITAMVVGALQTAPATEETRAAVNGALDYLVSLQKEDGSIHAGQYRNYVTSAAVMALARAGREKDAPVIAKARSFLQKLQIDEADGVAPTDPTYGGIGYGGDDRPDLSNLQMALDALNAAGVESDDPTMQKAVRFLERCQNRSESNDVSIEVEGGAVVESGDDGGAAYAPGDSKAGVTTLADGTKVPRSYGSMTYALLKSYVFAGLPKDDPRVQAAWDWLRRNYTLDVNPGFEASQDPSASYQGLYYYYYTMARTLDVYGEETIEDESGTAHAWRAELVARLAGMQRQDGSWVNEASTRWYEGNPVLATSYAMLALDEALPE